MSGIFLKNVFDRITALMSKAIVYNFSADQNQRDISDRIGTLNDQIIKYDSDLSWGNIEKSESTEADFLKEFEEIEAIIVTF
ncbi:MAG: hypothetical protein ACNFW9_01625 [Candidatus Kerfeldbacteria bacterium]